MTTRRPTSPTGPRIYLDSTRASTGTMLTASYEPRYENRVPRASFSAAPSSQSSSSRASAGFETQPVSKRTYADHSNPGATISRTEYAIRPRRNSGATETRRPLSLVTKNTTPPLDHVESPSQMVIYKPTREDVPRLLPPGQSRGSAHHQRHNSATRAETGRYFPATTVPRAERQYHARGPYVAKVAESRPVAPPARYEEPTYEYTNPREQFERDFPAPAPVTSRPRRESLTRRERPSSAIGTKFEAVPFRRETAPPPSVSRQLQRVDRDDSRSGFESDPDRARDVRRSRSGSIKGPIVHQRDDGYSSSRDDYQSKRSSLRPLHHNEESTISGSKTRYRDSNLETTRDRERPRSDYEREHARPHDRAHERDRHERRRDRSKEYERERERPRPRDYEIIEDDHAPRPPHRREPREDSDESPRSSGLKSLATAAVGGLAAATVAGHKSRKDDNTGSDVEGRREGKHRRHRSQDRSQGSRHDDDENRERRRHRSDRREHRQDSSGSDTPEDENSRRRPHSRTRRRPESQDTRGDQSQKAIAAIPPQDPERRPTLDSVSAAPRGGEQRENTSERTRQDSPTNNEGRTLSPGEGEDGRPRKVSIVEPLKDQKPEVKPKGILKPPRAVPFPEDPNPTREGVAPLKQAGKDGIPAGARWTKVSRILVNPEALERAHERFEERDDYVIVLRVLSREEIEKLAEKTREIREAREREWQKQVDERRRRRDTEHNEHDTEDEDDYDDGPEPTPEPQPLAIEPAPAAPPIDLRQFAQQGNVYPQQPQQQQHHQPQMTYAPPQGYPPQQPPTQEWHQQAQAAQQWPEQQWAPQPQFQQQQTWVAPESTNARNSAERIANTAPGQPIPNAAPGPNSGYNQAQPQAEANTYSQHV